ncbi:MAG: tyrosine-type recombinase/integrase [Aestuariibacter sp.]|nr:tyrosine-type recombinase/integrase [Aestuariibacter sp.]
MTETKLLGPWVRRFLIDYLVNERNLALNTRRSYRDTLVLLLPFIAQRQQSTVDRLEIEQLSPALVRDFLQEELEIKRHCAIATRNQRLAAIHAFARFVGEHSPEYIAWFGTIRIIPFKKTMQVIVPYLEKPEMDALLAAPDRSTRLGQRDYALLLFLYNTGARASEAAQVLISDLDLITAHSVKILGKGNKVRYCPLWHATIQVLTDLIANRHSHEVVFLNRYRRPMTRFGIHALVERCARKASTTMPSLTKKRISPHSVRHTTAVHLLRAGVDLNTIRAWLGHVSLETTNIYAQVDLKMKADALALCEVASSPSNKNWADDESLMEFLRAL